MKGAILEKGETGYTYLKKLFLSIRHAQKDFNWLITDCQCCTQSEAFYQRIFQYDRYGWLSGEELTRMVETEDFQWIWAVLSGFPRHISLAQVEIVPWDSSCTLVISRNHRIVSDFMDGFPLSRDLSLYNEQKGIFDESDELERWLSQHK